MNEHLEVHGFLYSVRFNGVQADAKKTSSLLFKVCRENLWNQTILGSSLLSSTVTLGGLLSSKVPLLGRLYLPLLSEFTPVPPPLPGAPRWRPSESWSTPRSSGQSPRPPPPARWTSHCSSVDTADEKEMKTLKVTEKRRTSSPKNCSWDPCCVNLILAKLQN